MENRKPDKLAVFDVCDTLYFSNTTHDFVRFVVDRSGTRSRQIAHRVVNGKFSPLRYAMIGVSVISGRDAAKQFGLKLLQGFTAAELDAFAADFVDDFLERLKIDQTHELIERFRGEGFGIVLCSSSIEPVVAAAAKKVAADGYFCTTLQLENGIFNGHILQETVGRKLELLRELDPAIDIEYAVSDNVSDLKLLEAAKHAIAVAHVSRKRAFWERHHFEIIDVGV